MSLIREIMGNTFFQDIVKTVIGGAIVGYFIWALGQYAIQRKYKSDAIRDLMSCRGDFNSIDFRRALNRISITFHYDEEIRTDVRKLYEHLSAENTPGQKIIDRAIVGLIFKLCKRNGFSGLTEYDIDQSFPESRQTPQDMPSRSLPPTQIPIPAPTTVVTSIEKNEEGK